MEMTLALESRSLINSRWMASVRPLKGFSASVPQKQPDFHVLIQLQPGAAGGMAVEAGLLGGAKVGQMSGVRVALGCGVWVGVADAQGLSVWLFDPPGGLPHLSRRHSASAPGLPTLRLQAKL